MQYVLLIYGDERQWTKLSPPDTDKMYAAYMKYTKDLVDAGIMRGGSELKPTSSATTVRTRNGKVTTVDGPFAETKEQLGGYYVIEVPNLEKALEWAAKCPGAATGSLEVRPLPAMRQPPT
jgi:hypothetical protein